MATVNDAVSAYAALYHIVKADPAEIALFGRVKAVLPRLVEALEAEVGGLLSAPAPVYQPAPEPAPAAPAVIGYNELAVLFERYDRNPADGIRKWFEDVEGGFDRSTPEQRREVYAKAKAWLEEDARKKRDEQSNIRPTVVQGGGGTKKTDPCPNCERRQVTTKFGERLRCDAHDTWWKVS